eukprot:g12101.t1
MSTLPPAGSRSRLNRLDFRSGGGRSHSTPSTVVSRGGSFGGGESTPSGDSGSSNVSGSGRGSGSSKSRSRRDGIGSSDGGGGGSSPTADGDGVTGESTVDGYAVLPPELSKAEAGRLKSWGRHGDVVVTSRLRSVPNRLVVASAEPVVEDETALMALVQDEEMQEAEEPLNGHEYVDLMDSLATSPTDYDAHESASNVLSLMCETAEEAPAEIALVIKETQGKSELESDFEMPSGPVFEAEIPPVSVAGVYKSRYKDAYLWAMKQEMKGIVESDTFTVLPGIPKGEKAVDRSKCDLKVLNARIALIKG